MPAASVETLREKIGDGKVLLALSGGVDSSVWRLPCWTARWAIS